VGESPPAELDDRILLERCQRGDLAAFEPLVAKYRDRVWRLAYRVLRDREEAMEVAQEAFIRAWQALPSFRGQSAFYTWLFRIAMNLATDRVRQRASRRRALGSEPVPEEDWERIRVDQTPSPDDTAAQIEERERLMRALEALPEHHRTIIMLSDLDGLSYREIAEVLQIPMGTVMSRLHNARKRLRDILGPALVVLLALLAGLAAARPAEAQQIVHFGARVLLASEAPPASRSQAPPPDERLDRFLPRLRQLFRYRDYTSLERYRAEVPVGTTQRWSVPGERQLEVTPEGVTGSTVRLQVRLMRGSMSEVNTHIQAAAGSPAVIGGPHFADGVLIIIVWANAGH
jgi:RNA polymerase sigma-70 factor (ECF subfamily)